MQICPVKYATAVCKANNSARIQLKTFLVADVDEIRVKIL